MSELEDSNILSNFFMLNVKNEQYVTMIEASVIFLGLIIAALIMETIDSGIGMMYGTFCFDANNLRDYLSYYLVENAPCDSYMWRVDVQDCGCFWSETFTFTPTCEGYGGCGDCCPICENPCNGFCH